MKHMAGVSDERRIRQTISQQKRASVAERQAISHGIRAVQQKAGSVLAARCMAILQCAA